MPKMSHSWLNHPCDSDLLEETNFKQRELVKITKINDQAKDPVHKQGCPNMISLKIISYLRWERDNEIVVCDTGLELEPPKGHSIVIHPHAKLSKNRVNLVQSYPIFKKTRCLLLLEVNSRSIIPTLGSTIAYFSVVKSPNPEIIFT